MKKITYNRYPIGNKRFNWRQKEYTLSTFAYLGVPDEEGERLLEIVDRATKNCKEAGFNLLELGWGVQHKAWEAVDMCEKYGVGMAIHMAESPIACMAAIHAAAAVQNVLAVEFHSVDIPWWNDLAIGIDNPLFKDGFVDVPNKPGLGIDELNEELISQHMHEKYPGIWESTTRWDNEWANDREWS